MSGHVDLIRSTFNQQIELNWTPSEPSLAIFVGRNGAGKSRLLSQICERHLQVGRTVLAISNTAYDKFAHIRGRPRLRLIRGAKGTPEKTLKDAIASGYAGDDLALRRVSRVLRHCGYLPDIGIEIRYPVGRPPVRRSELLSLEKRIRQDFEEFLSVAELLTRQELGGKIIWFNFDSATPDYSYRSILPRVVRWEKMLKGLGLIRDVKLHLRSRSAEIPVGAASSGELALISALAFLATNASDRVTVLIDEPENSLHPSWQREYLELLDDVLRYRQAAVFIATHSPFLISEANAKPFNGKNVAVVVLTSGQVVPDSRKGETPESLDGVLTEVFQTVTPQSHYLSVSLVSMLNRLESGVSSLAEVHREIAFLRSAGLDSRQARAVSAVEDMADQIRELGVPK